MTKLQNLALLIMRLVVAIIFIFAAYAKMSFWSSAPDGISKAMLYLIRFLSVVEPLGAVSIATGFLTRWAAIGLSIIMLGAIIYLKFFMAASFFTGLQGIGWDYNILILSGCIVLIAFGAGRFSLDAKKNHTYKPKES